MTASRTDSEERVRCVLVGERKCELLPGGEWRPARFLCGCLYRLNKWEGPTKYRLDWQNYPDPAFIYPSKDIGISEAPPKHADSRIGASAKWYSWERGTVTCPAEPR